MIIEGKEIADKILDELRHSPKPGKYLAAVQVGNDAATASFIELKGKIAKQLGIDFRTYRFEMDTKNDELRKEIGGIAAHKMCGGVVIELPMPEHLNWYYVLNAIPVGKDADVLGERALGSFYADRSKILPPAVSTAEEILSDLEINQKVLATKTVAVVGLGLLIGRPIANWIMRRAKETFLLRSTSDLGHLKQADIVISGIGKAGAIKPAMLKRGALVIDFGYSMGKGDFDPAGADEQGIRYTRTPGGTGPILVAKLFQNFYALNSDLPGAR